MELPQKVNDFIFKYNIDKEKLESTISSVRSKLSEARVEFDINSYASFGVLRLVINHPFPLQPVLFGAVENLTKLNKYLWNDSADKWERKMLDLSDRGTFLKRKVLLSKLLNLIDKYSDESSKIIDVGFGEGVLIRELIDKGKNVFGIDMTKKFVEKQKNDFSELKDHFRLLDVIDLKDKYDLVVCSMLLLDNPGVDLVLKTLPNSLLDKGKIIIVDINSKVYKAIGYYEGTKLVEVHPTDTVFYTEKEISGHTKAVHTFHPFNYYKNTLEELGLKCHEDFVFGPTEELINSSKELTDKQKQRLLIELKKDINNPPFHCLVFGK